jgi:alkaline phosphatase D
MIISNFKKVMPHLMKANVAVQIHGEAGIGKSSIVKQFAKETGYNFIYLTLAAVEDNSDLIGLLSPVKDELGNDIAVRHLKPDWFPTTTRNIIFLDEFSRLPKAVLQTMLTFILDKKLHTHYLPEDTHFIMASNPPSDKYITGDITDMALVTRMCHISLEPSVEEFLDFAASQKASDDMISFIQENPEMLEVKGTGYLPDIEFNRRTWLDFVSPFLLTNPPKDLIFEVVKGLVGTVAAVKFQNHIKNNQFKIKGREILNDYNKVLSNRVKSHQNDLDVLNIAGEELVREIKTNKGVTEKQGLNVVAFLQDCPIEYAYNLSRLVMGLGIESLNKNIGENTELIERMRNKLDGMSK